jgi:DNA polymerase-1
MHKSSSLLIVDGYGFIFRAYHVQPSLFSPTGVPVGAIYGFTSMLLKLIAEFKPERAIIVLDHGSKNFRHNLYKDYKANRPPAPDDLIIQFKLIREAAAALNFHVLEKEGFEADDIIATLARMAVEAAKEATVVSSDKDLMSLMSNHIKIYDPVKAKYISTEDVKVKFGVAPEKIREVQALMGDASDNIPGVAGIGPKTAAVLIDQFGTVESLFNSIDQLKNPRQKDLLTKGKDNALISWQLVGLDQDVPIDVEINSLLWSPPDSNKISSFLNRFGFKSLYKRIEKLFDIKVQEDLIDEKTDETFIIKEIVNSKDLRELDEQIDHTGIVAINIINDGGEAKVAISVNFTVVYLITIKNHNDTHDLFSYSVTKEANSNYINWLEGILRDDSIKKVTYNLKSLLKAFDSRVNCCDDIEIMDYCLYSGEKDRTAFKVIKRHLSDRKNDYIPSQTQITSDFIQCHKVLKNELFKAKIIHLYQSIDLPICSILEQMEQSGIKIDTNLLRKLSNDFSQIIINLEKDIFALTGEKFNISSPKQLGEVLFNKMNLPFSKIGGKSSSYVTGAGVLEKLSEEGYEIADLLLKYRHVTKLKSTYTDTLPLLADPKTSRIHTTFLQTSTTTGRLSSNNPNVQNIPIRTNDGNIIRSAFIASQGCKLISADYSQIEIRILSHLADMESLKNSFIKGEDIHARTASQIFKLPIDEITPEQRRKAKAINFGIIYGISAFGLAKQLNITNKEAANYIEKYFFTYPGIKEYMETVKNFARKHGYAENLLGRRCYVPSINSKNSMQRSFAERAAINAPLQSLAADIVKLAMIKVIKLITTKKFATKMILQIHDELIFEAPENEVSIVMPLIKEAMESAYILDVPMIVDINYGNNWQEIH